MNIQELLWKCAADECSPKELAELQTLLVADPALQQELKSIREVHTALKNMETEQPSMRFVQNVMEALPQNFYSPETAAPLLAPIWKKLFGVALAGLVLLLIFLARKTEQPTAAPSVPIADDFAQRINQVFGQIPPATMQYFVLVLAAVATLLFLDKAVKYSGFKQI